eukprot:GDKJ01030782.1.p1 GENE.GDKJ01030782.1~~GDKJ01030782.1.p1  ORF type:complete len:182 (-),score=20.16 GDKJ01030782.1:76-621(-)
MALQALGFGVLPQEQIDSMLRSKDDDRNIYEKNKREYEIDVDADRERRNPLPTQLDFVDFRHFVTKYMCKRNTTQEMVKTFKIFAGTASGQEGEEEISGDDVVTADDLMAIAEELGEFVPAIGDDATPAKHELRKAFLRKEIEQLMVYALKGTGQDRGIDMTKWCSIMQEAITDKRHKGVE